MQNDYILVPGLPEQVQEEIKTQEEEFLKIAEALGELGEKGLLTKARANLGVPSNKDLADFKEDINDSVKRFQDTFNEKHTEYQKEIDTVKDSLETFIKKDGTIPFEVIPKVGTKPLITKDEVDFALQKYVKPSFVNEKINQVLTKLENYVESKDVYTIDETYGKKDLDTMLDNKYIQKDSINSYDFAKNSKVNRIQKAIEKSIEDFKVKTANDLEKYYKKRDVWSRAESYSKDQIDLIIDKLVENACEDIIENHLNNTTHISSQDILTIVKNYAKSNLVDIKTLKNSISDIQNECEKHKPIWRTSGPVRTTVGFVEDNTELPAELTLQQILDQIFYGSKISISADEKAEIGEMVDVTMCVHIGIPVKSIYLYMNGERIDSFDIEDFEEGCITRSYGPILEDSEFTFTVTYDDDSTLSESTTVTAAWPLFVGVIPTMKFGSTITMTDLNMLIKIDPVNNEFVTDIPVTHRYNFKHNRLVYLIVGIPTKYNKELDYMTNQIQKFTKEAFNFHRISLTKEVNDQFKECSYDFYIYDQPLSSLNSDVTFNFV